jgi:hypothetical protein
MRAALLAVVAGAGCLPPDDRPEPDTIFVTAEPSKETKDGFVTADGWSVRFDRFVTAIGDVRLHDRDDRDEDCNDYAETRYEWLFDFTVVVREKVGLAFGLGPCSLEFRVRDPSEDTRFGSGATPEDAAAMEVERADAYVSEPDEATVVVEGTAEREVVKRFAWVFRRAYEIDHCPDGAGGYSTFFDFAGGARHELSVVVRGEELFRRAPDDAAPLAFDLYAQADADGDDTITFEEIDAIDVPVPDQLTSKGRPPPGAAPASVTLGRLVYDALLPRLARLAGGGPCEARVREQF